MKTYRKIGDTIKRDKIIVEARKILNMLIIVKIGRYKAQKTVLRDNTICYIDKRIRSPK